MKSGSLKKSIYDYLKSNPRWFFGGQLEDHFRELIGHKASNVRRRLQELAEEEQILHRYVRVGHEGPRVVQYASKSMQFSQERLWG